MQVLRCGRCRQPQVRDARAQPAGAFLSISAISRSRARANQMPEVLKEAEIERWLEWHSAGGILR